MEYPLCYCCGHQKGIRWMSFCGKGNTQHLKLCSTCKNKLFTPEGFVQFGYSLGDIEKLAKNGKGY